MGFSNSKTATQHHNAFLSLRTIFRMCRFLQPFSFRTPFADHHTAGGEQQGVLSNQFTAKKKVPVNRFFKKIEKCVNH